VARLGAAILLLATAMLASGVAPSRAAEPLTRISGRVVEVLTERPLEGVLVLIIWQNDPYQRPAAKIHAAREVLTDGAGAFSFALEPDLQTPPATVMPPRIVVYKPGYSMFPPSFKEWFGAELNRLAARNGVIELRPLGNLEERTETFNDMHAAFNQLDLSSHLSRTRQILVKEFETLLAILGGQSVPERKP
jgi:hypothetical protein